MTNQFATNLSVCARSIAAAVAISLGIINFSGCGPAPSETTSPTPPNQSDNISTELDASNTESDANNSDTDNSSTDNSSDGVQTAESNSPVSEDLAVNELPSATETPKPASVVNRPPVRQLAPVTDEEESMRVRPRSTIRRGGIRDLTFDDLEFEIERDGDFQREMLGKNIEELNGKQVIIRGFILAASVFQQSGFKEFVLVRDNQECCFGPGAYIYHNIQVDMAPGATADFSIRPVTIEGKLTIKPWIGPDDRCYSVFHILANKATK